MPDGTGATTADGCAAPRSEAGSADVSGANVITFDGKLSGSLKGRVRARRKTARPLYNHPGGAHNLNFF
jgi:hypothetical protein